MRAFAGPQDLIITPDGGYFLVADTGNNKIKILRPSTLNILGQFGLGYLKELDFIDIDRSGRVIVTDNENKCGTSFSFKGVYKNGTVKVKMIEQQISFKESHRSKKVVNLVGQRYVVNSSQDQIGISNRSSTQINIYKDAEKKFYGKH